MNVRRVSARLHTKISVIGERNAHLGPRWEFARVRVVVESADRFSLVDETGDDVARQEGYTDTFVRSLLNYLSTVSAMSPSTTRVTIESIEHDINSSLIAFHRAGEDAARKIADSISGA